MLFKNLKSTAQIACLFILVFCGSAAFALDYPAVESALKKTFPQIRGAFALKESPIKGLYEITLGNDIVYFYPQANDTADGYLIFGEIWNKDGQSLTGKRREENMASMLKNIPLEKAIKIGSGKNIVIEFTDPDCPFCRKVEDFFSSVDDVTRYVFLFPLPQLHPDSEKKSKYILCSADKTKAYKEVMQGSLDNGKYDILPICVSQAGDMLKDHLAMGTTMGIKGTPAFFVNGTFVNGANIPLLEKTLKGGN